ncbi:hypothetical protein KL930_001098 [Ogataea haglerorum]|uniref:Ribonuclease P protein subunit n=1 Tax=Ogataea haglerorum TaxID=1937702 RepID=A0AAN6I398_9ASCO|nr:uncharacterized protein KL911_001307 [Ogataea haglerorum]KAG7700410.1 hypothetical protein KL915_001099 [Ogataea haglerorum]KAG7702069.1 hypothetical protein KL951_000525 [Ogataea haglerorum]KAG7711883.1 hypothetical protein KL914_000525 [Ogataea haglerorum]KAG7712654.1 hypothetical protein KL950_000525 [Ogataea haglerorum]KAG7722704.1 hypothetical protein KL913_000524 [Ogataea haglerorum]
MDRKHTVEHLLLSRSSKFQDDGEISKLLESRYSLTGSQKSYLSLKATEGTHGKKHNQRLIMTAIQLPGKQNRFSPTKTKNEFKSFIADNLKYQNRLIRQLQLKLKKDPNLLNNLNDIAELRICKNLIRYEDYVEMNRLWKGYIQEILGTTNHIPTMVSKLSSSELIGSELEVIQSRCINNTGTKGIVIWESQHNFVMVVPRKANWKSDISTIKPEFTLRERIGGLRVISKRNTNFRLHLETEESSITFEIIGNRLMIRSTDRATRRFKNHSVKDIDV